MQNVSLGGYGAILPLLRSDWLQIGCLLAVRGEHGDWQIGVVGRLQYDAERQTHVGIEVLAARLMAVRVRMEGRRMSATMAMSTRFCLVPRWRKCRPVPLLMRSSSYIIAGSTGSPNWIVGICLSRYTGSNMAKTTKLSNSISCIPCLAEFQLGERSLLHYHLERSLAQYM